MRVWGGFCNRGIFQTSFASDWFLRQRLTMRPYSSTSAVATASCEQALTVFHLLIKWLWQKVPSYPLRSNLWCKTNVRRVYSLFCCPRIGKCCISFETYVEMDVICNPWHTRLVNLPCLSSRGMLIKNPFNGQLLHQSQSRAHGIALRISNPDNSPPRTVTQSLPLQPGLSSGPAARLAAGSLLRKPRPSRQCYQRPSKQLKQTATPSTACNTNTYKNPYFLSYPLCLFFSVSSLCVSDSLYSLFTENICCHLLYQSLSTCVCACVTPFRPQSPSMPVSSSLIDVI